MVDSLRREDDLFYFLQCATVASPRDLEWPERVKEETGFSIGGVPPVGHKQPLQTWIDNSLSRFETVYAAAGHPCTVFPIPFETLVGITDGRVADVTDNSKPSEEG